MGNRMGPVFAFFQENNVHAVSFRLNQFNHTVHMWISEPKKAKAGPSHSKRYVEPWQLIKKA